MRWMAVSDTDKLDLFLIVGREELQKLIEKLRSSLGITSHIFKS